MHECLRLANSRQALLEVGVHDGDAVAGELVGPGRLAAEHDRGEGQRDDHAHGDQGKPRVEHEKGDTDTDEGAHAHEGREEAVLYERLELVDVGGHPGHDPARHLPLVVVERQPLEVRPDPDAQRHHDALGGAPGHERRSDLIDQVSERDDEIDRRRDQDHRLRAGGDTVVDALFHEDGPGQGRQGVESHEQQPEPEWSAVLAEQRPEAEVAHTARLGLEVDTREVSDRPERGYPRQELRSGCQVQAPSAACAQAWAHARRSDTAEGLHRRHLWRSWDGRRRADGGEHLDAIADRFGLFLLEPREKGAVEGTLPDELLVRADVDNAALVEDSDAIGEVQRGAAVGYQERRAALHDHAQGGVDPLFHLGVDGARGVVEDEDARVGEDRPGERHPLALTARQGEPSLSDDGVVAPRQLFDELVRLGSPCGGLDLLEGGVRPAVSDVRPHRVGEEEALLEDDADLATQRRERHVADIVPVHSHGAGDRVIETGHHVRQSRLPTTARADEGHGLARLDLQADSAQHRWPVVVGEPNVVEDDLTRERRQLDSTGGIDDRRLQVEQLEDPLDARPCLLADGQDAGEHAGRGHELGQIGREREEGPERDLVADGQVPAQRKDADLAETRDGLEQGLVTRLEADRPHLGAVELGGGGRDALELPALLAVGLHDADPVHVLVDDLGDIAFSLLAVPGGGEDPPPHPVGDEQQRRGHEHAHDGKQRGEVEHDPERKDKHEDVAAHDREEAEKALHEHGVGVRPGDELARRHAVEVGEVEPLQVVLHGVAQVVLDVESHAATPVTAEVGTDEGHYAQAQQCREPGRERR